MSETIPEEPLEPGPDGKLISSEERIQMIQQQKADNTPERKSVELNGT